MTALPAPNTTPIPNAVFDEILPTLQTLAEVKVYLYLLRRMYGFKFKRDSGDFSADVTIDELCRGIRSRKTGEMLDGGTGMTEKAVTAAVHKLAESGHIERVVGNGRGHATCYTVPIEDDASHDVTDKGGSGKGTFLGGPLGDKGGSPRGTFSPTVLIGKESRRKESNAEGASPPNPGESPELRERIDAVLSEFPSTKAFQSPGARRIVEKLLSDFPAVDVAHEALKCVTNWRDRQKTMKSITALDNWIRRARGPLTPLNGSNGHHALQTDEEQHAYWKRKSDEWTATYREEKARRLQQPDLLAGASHA